MRFSPAWAVPVVFFSGCLPITADRDATSQFDANDVFADTAASLDTAPVVPTALWVLPRNGPNEFLLPWPSDLTLTPDGYTDLTYVPNPGNNNFVSAYEHALVHRLRGFSTVAAAYFRFTVPIDTSTLPTSAGSSVQATSSVQLIDIDPASPDHGTRRPVQWFFHDVEARYWPGHSLAVAPVFGFPMRGHTRYAIVITRSVHAASGAPLQRDADLEAVLAPTGGDANVASARSAMASALAEITAAGVATDNVLSLAVFTTQDPTAEMFRAVTVAQTYAPAASILPAPDLHTAPISPAYTTYEGHYGPNPIFQTGTLPYTDAGSGDFTLDANGNPVVQGVQNITFALSVPHGTMPANGWPIVIYAHGTGGDATSFLTDGTALALAQQGLAVFGFDQIFNGDRTIGGPSQSGAEAQFFNFTNPLAGRTNNRQACLDLVTAGRLVRTMVIPAAVSSTSSDIRFDPTRVMFFGHSQGGLNGPLWLASENGAGAAVLSGAGGTLSLSITEKTQPVNIPLLVATVIGIPASTSSTELVPLHPVITLAQTIVDVSDPVNYGRYIVLEPRPGLPPRHVFQTQGFVDHYAPDDAIASLALSIGLPMANPVLVPVPALVSMASVPSDFPFHLNLAHGTATGGWQQFNAPRGDDGHFVVFDVPTAQHRAATFLGSYASDPAQIPTLQ